VSASVPAKINFTIIHADDGVSLTLSGGIRKLFGSALREIWPGDDW